jgi:Ran GTPase-activating protein (RanGAP) involved in mRNA processing and transport
MSRKRSIGLDPFEQLCVDLSCGEEIPVVDFSRFKGLSQAQIASVSDALKEAENFQVLRLKGSSVGIADAKLLGKALAESTANCCTELDFTNMKLGAAGINQFAEFISTSQVLTTLFLCGNAIDAPDAKALSRALKANRSVTALFLRRNEMGPDGVANLVDSIAKMPLITLDIRGNAMEVKGIRSMNGYIKTSKVLETLFLDSNNIGDEGAKILGNTIKRTKALRTLFLRGNGIGPAGASSLAEGLAVNETITSLQVGGNKIGFKGAEHFKNALVEKNRTLQHLCMGACAIGNQGCQSIAAILCSNTTITSLNVYGNSISEAGAKAVASGLRMNSTLTMLDIGVNLLGPDGAAQLMPAVADNRSLTLLDLKGNRIFDEGAGHVSEMLKKNTDIRSLKLSTNNITDTGIAMLATALQTNTSLKSLNLSMNKIRNPGVQALLSAVRGARGGTQLCGISMNGCQTVNPNDKAELDEHFKDNKLWHLSHEVVPEDVSDGEESEEEVQKQDEEKEGDGEGEEGEDEEGDEVPVDGKPLTPRRRGEDKTGARTFTKPAEEAPVMPVTETSHEEEALASNQTDTATSEQEAPVTI